MGATSATYDVVVVGAGLAGSGIAAGLAGLGWQVLLVERDQFPRHKVCGEFISPEAQATLQSLGLYQAVAKLAPVDLHTVQLISPQGYSLRRPLPGTAWGLSRYALDAALASAAVARGAELWTSTSANGWSKQGNHYLLQLRRQDEVFGVKARALIMAYGRSGPSGLARKGADEKRRAHNRERYVGVKAHYAGLSLPPQVELFFFRGGYAGLNPVEGGHANLCLLASYRAFAKAGRSIPAMMAAAARGNPALAARLAGAELVDGTECAVAPVDTYRRARPWDGVAALGDSAVMLPPLSGDGMAMALRSADICLPMADAYLRYDLTMVEWAAKYSQAWTQEFGPRLRIGRWMQSLLRAPRMADGMLATGALLPPLADYFIRATRGEVSSSPPSVAAPESSSAG
jgi:menaquinone-9 beta-reductase